MKVSQGNQKWCYSISYTLLSIADLLTETMAGIGYYYCCCFLYGLQNCTKFARLITRRVIGTHRYNAQRKSLSLLEFDCICVYF